MADPNGTSDYLVMPNGARIPFTTPTNTADGTYSCLVSAGYPYYISKIIASGVTYFQVYNLDGAKMLFQDVTSTGAHKWWSLVDSYNVVGHYVKFQYDGSVSPPRLSAVLNESNATLLSVARDGSGFIQKVSDAYGRSVWYQVHGYAASATWMELDHVSQIGASTLQTAPADRYNYGYMAVPTGHLSESFALLHTITVPSPTGAGTKTATINYDTTNGTGYVTSLVDANQNVRAYSTVPGDINHTQVDVYNQQTPTVIELSYRVGFNADMSQTDVMRDSVTNPGSLFTPLTLQYTSSLSPFRPSTVTAATPTSFLWLGDSRLNSVQPSGKYKTVFGYDNNTPPRLNNVYQLNFSSSLARADTQITYGANGLPSTVSTPVPGRVFDPVNPPVAHNSVALKYDSLGNTTEVSSASAVYTLGTTLTALTSYSADGTSAFTPALGQPVKTSSATTDTMYAPGTSTHIRYYQSGPNYGLPQQTWDDLNITTTYDYNLSGQPLHTYLPATTDLHGNVTGGKTIQYVYLYDGGPLSQVRLTDANATLVRQTTNTLGNEGETLGTQELGQAAHTADTTYDSLYRVKTVSDGNGSQTSYTYNKQGLLWQVRYPGEGSPNGSTLTTYDNYDRPLQVTDQRGYTRNFVYSGDNLSSVTYKSGATTLKTIYYNFDNFGRVTAVNTADAAAALPAPAYHSQLLSYDDLDNVVAVENKFATSATATPFADFQFDTTYFPTGDVSSSTLTNYTSGSSQLPFTTSLSYFDDGRPKTLSTANTGLTAFNASFSWNYLTNGWLNKQTAFKNNGASVLTTTYALNQLAQPVEVLNVNANSVELSKFTDIAYDAAGNHTSHTETLPFLSAFGGTQSYQYDSKDQLLSDQKTNSASDNYSAGFSFDSAGNLINGGSVGYNAANQLTSFGALYDLSGNQRSLPVSGTANRAADYDPDDHLTSLQSGFTAGYYTDGSRMWKQPGGGSATYFLYQDGPIPAAEFDGSGNITAVNAVGPTGLLRRSTANGATWNQSYYAYNWRGDTVNRLDKDGNLVSNSTYRAYGTRVCDAESADPYDGFGGQHGYYKEVSSGLWTYLLGARYYSPDEGRFLSRDPISYAGGINVYSYAGNNPINNVDPSGLESEYTKPKSCPEIAKRIYNIIKELEDKIDKYDPAGDAVGGFNTGHGKLTRHFRHYDLILDQQQELLYWVKRFNDQCNKGGKPFEPNTNLLRKPVYPRKDYPTTAPRFEPWIPVEKGLTDESYLMMIPVSGAYSLGRLALPLLGGAAGGGAASGGARAGLGVLARQAAEQLSKCPNAAFGGAH